MPQDSLLNRRLHGGDVVEWTPVVELLAQVKHVLQMANWQRGGGKGQRPKPLERPGSRKRLGRTSRPQSEVRALLDSYSAER